MAKFVSTASYFSKIERKSSSEMSGKNELLSPFVPNAKRKTLLKKRKKRKSIINIERKKGSLQHELQEENQWVDNLINMFTVPVVKLHINDDKGILSKDKSIDRIINLTLIVTFVLAAIVSAALAQFGFQFGLGPPTRIILPNDGTTYIFV